MQKAIVAVVALQGTSGFGVPTSQVGMLSLVAMADKDSNGALSSDEVAFALDQAHLGDKEKKAIVEMFHAADANNDGEVSPAEMSGGVQRRFNPSACPDERKDWDKCKGSGRRLLYTSTDTEDFAVTPTASDEDLLFLQDICNNDEKAKLDNCLASGGVQEQCYPAEAVVMTEQGTKTMQALVVGDAILGFNPATSQNEFTAVRAWLHRFPNKLHTYNVLNTEQGALIVSDYHNVAHLPQADSQPEYMYAKDLGRGSLLQSSTGPAKITDMSQELKQGMYAPLTGLSNYYVGSSAEHLYLSHAFAHVEHPSLCEGIVHAAMYGAELWSSNAHDLPSDDDENYVHPVAKTFQAVFPFLMESAPRRRLATDPSNNNKHENNYDIIGVFASMANSVIL